MSGQIARRNFVLNVADGNAFIFGISTLSRLTVLPLFVERLSGQAWMQGLIPALFYIGWLLPGLFIAPIIASLPRRKPWIMSVTLGERIPFLILGLVLLLMPDLPPMVLLGLFFTLYGIYSLSGGLAGIAWQDFIARQIPPHRWGMFFGLQSGIGGLFGVAGAAVATSLLATQPFPQSVGMLALICFAGQAVSYVLLGMTVETAQEVAPRQPLRLFLRGILPLLRREEAFRRYLFCRTAIALGLVGHSFLTASALEQFTLSDSQVGLFTLVLVGSQALANVALGTLADRWGHKQVLELSTALGMLALLLALIAPGPLWFLPIFALVGAAQAGYQLSGFTLVFAFSTPAERPLFLGVANTALAPAAAIGPLLAGVLAGTLGYPLLFALLLIIGTGGLAGLHWRVTAPARAQN